MVQVSYPGVYIQEVPSGVHTITGVATSIAVFVGRARQGPLDKPTLCLNYGEFLRIFSADTRFGDMARSVRLLFENGGSRCYVMRIANGATPATVTLQSEANTGVLTLTAKSAGVIGETIRAAVTYNGLQPEVTFNMEIFRWETNARGELVKQDREVWPNLSMDPLSPRFAKDILTQNSKLVDAAVADTAPTPGSGYSQSGRPVPFTVDNVATFRAAWAALFGNGVTTNRFQISTDGNAFVDVDLSGIDVGAISPASISVNTVRTGLANAIKTVIDAALPVGTVNVSFEPGPTPSAADDGSTRSSRLLRISSPSGDVFIRPASSGDVAGPLMLGTDQGGLEVSRYAASRPAPSGITLRALTGLVTFAGRRQDAFNTITISGTPIPVGTTLQTVDGAAPMFKDAYATSVTGNNDGIREKLAIIQTAINDFAGTNPDFAWKAEVWGSRLAIIPTSGGDNSIGTLATAPADAAGDFTRNVRHYSLGIGGTAGLQTPAGTKASDGTAPLLSHYASAYSVIEKEVDLFNLLILPTDVDHTAATTASLWGPASRFCQEQRAFLLMDPPAWTTVQQATNPTTGVNALRRGLVKDHSAVFYPRIIVRENGLRRTVGPAGAIAGLMARIDAERGVWKAPAGVEADIIGIAGIDVSLTDLENGVLNKEGVNCLRSFPSGIVNWGARTMDGADDFGSEWKYIPIRRLALFLEESLFRGTKWVVFEPNDEPLWAKIRQNLNAFMMGLFRQGAFQGSTPAQAFYVKCDAETTTQADRNLGIVNIEVGFAPLKPAEFVVIKIQQIAGEL